MRFRRLVRHFLRGLVDNDLVARADDLHTTAAGALAALVVTAAAMTLSFLGKYNSVSLRPRPGFVPPQLQTLAEKLGMALDDKALLIGGAMIVMALIVVVWWDALVLDERDAAVLGPLPLLPAMVLLAKAAAVSGVALVVAVALNLLPALLFPFIVLMKTTVSLAHVVRAMAAHGVAGVAGCIFVFLTLSSLRTAAALFRRDGSVARALPFVQFVLVLVLLVSLIALPGTVSGTRGTIAAGSPRALAFPWLWFVGLGEVLSGRSNPLLEQLSRAALTACGIAAAVTGALHVAAFRLRFHRAGAPAASPRSIVSRLAAASIERLAVRLPGDGRARASFLFTARTIARSPRHRLYAAASLGAGLAVAGATIAAAWGGHGFSLKSMGLAAQLNLIFFLVVGLRMAATVPADIDAGWTFQFLASPARERHLAGTRAAIFFLTILPLLIMLVPVHVWAWGTYTALVHFAFGVAAALGLLEVVFTDYRRMPFISSFVPGRTVLTPLLGLYGINYLLFAYLTPQVEQLLVERTGLLYAWLALLAVAVARLVRSQSARLIRDQLPVFEHAEPDVQELHLWDAVHARGTDSSAAAFTSGAQQDLFGGYASPTSARLEGQAGPWTRARPRLGLARLPAELGYAARTLAAQPAFTVFSVLTLALAIASTAGMYSVIYSTVLRPLDVNDLDSLVNVYHSSPMRGSRPLISISLPDYRDFADAQRVFSATAAHAPFAQVAVAAGEGHPTVGEMVTGRYFEVLGLRPAFGRLLQPADDAPGATHVAVIDDRTWQRRFDRRPDVIGSDLTIAGRHFEIVGVTPPSFHGVELPNLAPTAVWVPLTAAIEAGFGPPDDREARWLGVKGRLAPGRTLAEAQAELGVIAAQLDRAYPIGRDLPPNVRNPPSIARHWVALPASDRLVTEQADAAMIRLARLTMIAMGLVLLVACTNLSNLTLARGVSKRRDVAIRLALGASRWEVVREQLVEHALIAASAAAAAFVVLRLIVVYGLGLTLRMGGWVEVDARPVLDAATILAGMAATALAMFASGVLPALGLSRTASVMAAASAPAERWSGRRMLIAAQVSVSVALIAIAGLCARHIAMTASLDTGIDLDRLAFVRYDFTAQGWPQARAERTLQRMVDHASAMTPVESVAIASGLPLRGASGTRSIGITAAERPFRNPTDSGASVTLVAATPSIFRTLGIAIASGRTFTAADSTASARVAVLSELAARKLFTGGAAVGRQVVRRVQARAGAASTIETLTVVGIAGDSRNGAGEPTAVIYVPLAQEYQPSAIVLARTAGDPAAVASALRSASRGIDAELGVIDAGVGASLAGTEALAFEIMGALAGTLGTAAMVLAMIGLYGVLSFVIAQRRREIGIRVALGATTGRITRLVLGEGLRPVVEGLIIGFVIADIAEMMLRPALQKPLPAIDATVLTLVPVPFLIAAAAACYLPSRRAAAVDPSVALRNS